MFSLYSTLYNLEKMKFPWQESIENWIQFLSGTGEIILVLNKSNDNSDKLLSDFVMKMTMQYAYLSVKIRIIRTDFDLTSAYFDGEIKNVGYKNCKSLLTIALDLDECISVDSFRNWAKIGQNLLESQFDSYIIPSINIWGNWKQYKDIGSKFYMVKNKPYIKRGIVNYANLENGNIDINKSDSTEFVLEKDNSLITGTYIVPNGVPDWMKLSMIKNGVPFVWHRGAENLEHRKAINEWWEPIWSKRAGKKVDNIVTDIKELEKIQTYPHNLQHWSVK